MRILLGKVLPGLAMCIAISEAGATHQHAMDASAGTPLPPAMAANQAEPGRHPDAGSGLRVAFQYGLPGRGDVASGPPASEIRPVLPVSVAKTSALVLSSFGMLSLIALLRLNWKL